VTFFSYDTLKQEVLKVPVFFISAVVEFGDGALCFLNNIILQNFVYVLVEFSLDVHVVYTAQFWKNDRTGQKVVVLSVNCLLTLHGTCLLYYICLLSQLSTCGVE
jgi:hypothetical protein